MNRTIKDATVKRYHYESHDQLREHLQSFIMAYNFAKRLIPILIIHHPWALLGSGLITSSTR